MKKIISPKNIDLSIIIIVVIVSFFIFAQLDLLEKFIDFSHRYEDYELDEILSTLSVLSVCLIWFSCRRWKETVAVNEELQVALADVKTLEGIMPICMHCKEIRDEKGDWNQLEKYICEHSDGQFSHSICDKCLKEHYPEMADLQDSL